MQKKKKKKKKKNKIHALKIKKIFKRNFKIKKKK